MLIPIGTDHPRRHFPWATLGLIVGNVLVYTLVMWMYAFFGVLKGPVYADYQETESRLVTRWLGQQGEPDPVRKYRRAQGDYVAYKKLISDFKKAMEAGEVVPLESSQYEKWSLVSQEYEKASRKEPFYLLGFVPADMGIVSLITHMFVHGDIWHLFWNMYFLWLVGVGLEDIWGRRFYLGIYLAGGIFAALFHALLTVSPDVPIVGASGAIAALMGAFLIRMYKARMRFAFFHLIFLVPAWAPLLFWMGRDAQAAIKGLESGIAVWAHVGGYLFGIGAALILIKTGVEQTIIAKAVEKQDEQDVARALARAEKKKGPARLPEYGQGVAARQRGNLEEARGCFRQVLEQQPLNHDARDELMRIDRQLGHPEYLTADLAASIAAFVKTGDMDSALSYYLQLMEHAPKAMVGGAWTYRVAQELSKRGSWEHAAWEFIRFAACCKADPLAPKALLAAATIEGSKRGNPKRALDLIAQLKTIYPGWMPEDVENARRRFEAMA